MDLKQEIIEMIDRLFSDTRVSPEVTLDQLQEIRDEITTKMECIESDLSR